MKISSNLSSAIASSVLPKNVQNSAVNPFTSMLQQMLSNERKVDSGIAKISGEFKGLIELQRSCSSLQIQVSTRKS